MSENISDTFPASKTINLPNGKKLVIGNFTLAHAMWIETKYGSFETFQKEIIENDKTIADKVELIFQLLENKEDFKNLEDFAGSIPMNCLTEVIEALTVVMSNSVPELPAGTEEGAEEKK